MAGTALGNILGITEEDEKEKAKEVEENTSNYKGESQFASHLKEQSDAVSAFARSKTVREQRQYLPAFAIREELLQIIRDNNGKAICI